jgi:phenylalanyl-tRNA synthetase beta chain
MNISYRWLRELAPGITDSAEQLAERLGMLGAPVDELAELSAEIRDVVIARVDEVRQHPNADRLRICSVVAGGDEAVQVVCGAPNVEAGGFYPFAPVGATLPGGVQIRKAKLRGESSEGMLCSARELGLGREHAGLLALSGDWEPGSSFVEQLGLEDSRLEVDITPNRPDLLSHLGVARELAPGGVEGIQLRSFGGEEPTVTFHEGGTEGRVGEGKVVIEDPAGCRRYIAAIVRGVKVGPSPEWLATRLRAIGVRPINNVVDATNYVLHELGQPLHAFDLKRIGGGEIRVRGARAGEGIRTLDGVDRELAEGMLVIADAGRRSRSPGSWVVRRARSQRAPARSCSSALCSTSDWCGARRDDSGFPATPRIDSNEGSIRSCSRSPPAARWI